MTVTEIFEQAITLKPQERKELAKLLIDSLDVVEKPTVTKSEEHWGKSLNQLLNEIGPIKFVDPEIEDPVEWVKAQREKERKRRLGDWGE